ncbi:hypothetical protein C7T35_21500 [Variovorax sp. WS11]|nr:hypothetical protein C7T35_21500 [Variovorax sp. WS11]
MDDCEHENSEPFRVHVVWQHPLSNILLDAATQCRPDLGTDLGYGRTDICRGFDPDAVEAANRHPGGVFSSVQVASCWVPRKPVIEQRLGQPLAATVRAGEVSCQIGRRKGLSIG